MVNISLQKDVFNLMNNSVFGETMEHVKHRIDLRLTTDPNMALKQFPMLNFNNKAKYPYGLYKIENYKTKVVLLKQYM